jgi:hypothetical protein
MNKQTESRIFINKKKNTSDTRGEGQETTNPVLITLNLTRLLSAKVSTGRSTGLQSSGRPPKAIEQLK